MPPVSKKQQKMMCAHCKGKGKMMKKVKGLTKEVACEYCAPVAKGTKAKEHRM